MGIVGVLALQGGFGLHRDRIRDLGYPVREVRDASDLEGLGALVLPGGESTTMGLLMERRGLAGPLIGALQAGLPALGTCAGAILLARSIAASSQFRLGVLDIEVERNAYGSQIDSFEVPLDLTGVAGAARVPAVFIRAPRILTVGPGVEVLASWAGYPALVRQGALVAATFHPELTPSAVLHRWFLETVAGLPVPQAGPSPEIP